MLLSLYERHYLRLLAAIAAVSLGAAGFVMGYVKGSPKSASAVVSDWSARAAGVLTEAWRQTASGRPEHFLQPSRKSGSGVVVNDLASGDDLVLLTGFFDSNPGLRLIRRDGSVVVAWNAAFSKYLPERLGKPGAPQTDWNIDLHGSYIEPDGSVVFNFEYQGAVKLSRCGERLWALPDQTHHSIEPASAGGYWIGGLDIHTTPDAAAYWPLVPPDRAAGRIQDDLILHVSKDGEILSELSVFQLLMDNGFEPVLSATGDSLSGSAPSDNELLHVNMIAELSPELAPAFPDFAAGDLVISVRDYNLVVVVDPESRKVKWHSTGPWLRQHSAHFLENGTIGVFNNNAYSYQSLKDGVTDLSQPRTTEILTVDPKTGEAKVRYGSKPGQEMLSVFRGYYQAQPGGGFLITEPEAGRVLQTDAAGRTVWEYINRYDDDHVLEMTGARAYPASYFTVTDWSCR